MSTPRLVTLCFVLLAACSSKITSTLDTARLQKRINTVQDCFPGLYVKAQAVLDVAATWRLDASPAVPDPSGLAWSEQPDGTIDATYAFSGCTLAMTISFYSPTGALQDLDLTGASTLADAVELAATELHGLFGFADQFMVGAWTLTGPGIAGAGALTGILGGSGNQNQLLELRTTTAVPAGGPPPNADSMITDDGPPLCVLTWNTTGLMTDNSSSQQYPIGVLSVGIAGPEDADVTANITFDGTATARIVVSSVPGYFDFALDTQSLAYVQ